MSVCVYEEVVYKQTNQPEKARLGEKVLSNYYLAYQLKSSEFLFLFSKGPAQVTHIAPSKGIFIECHCWNSFSKILNVSFTF